MKPTFSTLRRPNLKPMVVGWRRLTARATAFIQIRPFSSFLGLLAVMVALVVIGNWLRKPPAQPTAAEPEPKPVSTYTLGGNPTVSVQAKVDKSGVITVVAQTAGIVNKLNVTEGQSVYKGQRLVSLASNYQGANAASLTRQLSQRSYQHTLDTYDTQKALIQQQRELADKNEVQAKELRAIGREAESDTRTLIDLNNEIVSYLDQQLASYEASNVNGSNDAVINDLKGAKAQVLGGLSGLKASLNASEYTNSEDEEIAGITGLVRATTHKQLDLQEKALDLSRDVALLNVRLAQVGESLMYPAAPSAAVVERVHVSVGQAVSPGMPIATLTAKQGTVNLEALVVAPIAKQVSLLTPSVLLIDGQQLKVTPRYVSTEPTNGSLYSVLFTLSDEVAAQVHDGELVSLTLTLGARANQDAYIPLDAVYYSQSGAYVFIADTAQTPARAKVQKVTLGHVYGPMVEVIDGLPAQVMVILDRNVVDTDPVQPAGEIAQ